VFQFSWPSDAKWLCPRPGWCPHRQLDGFLVQNHFFETSCYPFFGKLYAHVCPACAGETVISQAGQLMETEDTAGASGAAGEFHHEELPMLFPTGAPEAGLCSFHWHDSECCGVPLSQLSLYSFVPAQIELSDAERLGPGVSRQ